MLILALESSTTSSKAMLLNTDTGETEVRSKVFPVGDDISLHDPELVFQTMARLGRELAAGRDVQVLALSNTWHSVMLCDRDMKPLTPIYQWTNTEASGVCKPLRRDDAYTQEYYHKTGCMVNAIFPFFKLKMFKERGYDISKHKIVGQGTYNTWRLTGQWVVTDAVASGSGLLNTHTKKFDPDLLAELGISESNLGRLITYMDTLTLSDAGADLLGLKRGIPVVAGMPDGALNQVGSKAVKDGVMILMLGTSGSVRFATPEPRIPKTPSTWCYVGPDTWISGAATSGCCNCVDWFIAGAYDGKVDYAGLDAEASRIKGDTPVFLPFVFGERCPGWDDDRSGGFLLLKPSHTRVDMYRAILEGTLFNLYHCFEALRSVNGPPKTIKLSGGILNSGVWTQMAADIFNHPLIPDDIPHASAMGAAYLACRVMGIDEYSIPAPATGKTAGEDERDAGCKTVNPDPEAVKAYTEKYARYRECYARTAPGA